MEDDVWQKRNGVAHHRPGESGGGGGGGNNTSIESTPNSGIHREPSTARSARPCARSLGNSCCSCTVTIGNNERRRAAALSLHLRQESLSSSGAAAASLSGSFLGRYAAKVFYGDGRSLCGEGDGVAPLSSTRAARGLRICGNTPKIWGMKAGGGSQRQQSVSAVCGCRGHRS